MMKIFLKEMSKLAREMIKENGIWVCPRCHQRKFRKVKGSGTRYIKDYDIAPEDKQDLGMFKFVYVCDNCGFNIVEYGDA